jgi:hypothetical protein
MAPTISLLLSLLGFLAPGSNGKVSKCIWTREPLLRILGPLHSPVTAGWQDGSVDWVESGRKMNSVHSTCYSSLIHVLV